MEYLKDPDLKNKYMSHINVNQLLSSALSQYMSLVKYSKGEYIYCQEDVLHYIFILTEGTIKVSYASSNGKETVFRILNQPRIMGEMELILDRPALSTVEAEQTTYCFLLPLSQCRNILLNDTVFLRHICFNLADALSVSNTIASNNASYPPKYRVAAFILSTEREGHFSMEYKTVSSIVGISERHLFRIVSELVQDGLISKQKHDYKITDYTRLNELSGDFYEN